MGFQINHIGAHQGDDHRILIYSRIHHSPIKNPIGYSSSKNSQSDLNRRADIRLFQFRHGSTNRGS